MKTLIALLLSVATCYAQPWSDVTLSQPVVAAAATASPTYLIKQGFEGTGYDNSEAWTEAATADEDYATSPAPLVGSQSLQLSGTGARAYSPEFASQTECWAYFVINVSSLPASGSADLALLVGAVGVEINSSGNVRVYAGVNGNYTTDAMSTGTTYYCRLHFLSGAGADFEFTTTTFAGSGNKFSSLSSASATSSTVLQLRAEGGQTSTSIFDKVRVDDVLIGDSPE